MSLQHGACALHVHTSLSIASSYMSCSASKKVSKGSKALVSQSGWVSTQWSQAMATATATAQSAFLLSKPMSLAVVLSNCYILAGIFKASPYSCGCPQLLTMNFTAPYTQRLLAIPEFPSQNSSFPMFTCPRVFLGSWLPHQLFGQSPSCSKIYA